jgi:hypothetical protein
MSRFVIEHLPRAAATYEVTPLNHEQATLWLQQVNLVSVVRTTEMITAIEAFLGVTLSQSDVPVALRPGDEALLVTLSFGVLLAWAEGKIAPLPEDWRWASLRVKAPTEFSSPDLEIAVAEPIAADDVI